MSRIRPLRRIVRKAVTLLDWLRVLVGINAAKRHGHVLTRGPR